jgi:hypothetical protein
MSFVANFSAAQSVNGSDIILTDTSTGSDSNLTGRAVSLFLVDGSLLGGSVVNWPLSSGSTLTISGILPRDYSVNIQVVWSSSSPLPPPSVYTVTGLATFAQNSEIAAYSLLQQIASNVGITRDNDYMYNLALVNSDILNALRSNTFNDQFSAQSALDRIYEKTVTNKNFYF